jgi:hypothetical protein
MQRALNPRILSKTSILRSSTIITPRIYISKHHHLTNMTNSPTKRPSTADLSDRTAKKPHSMEEHLSTSSKKSAIDPSQNHEKSDSTEGIHEWKKRPPYQIHTRHEDFHARHEGSCHCGKVKYQLSREEPLDSKLCHCTTCQTQHGTSIDPKIN